MKQTFSELQEELKTNAIDVAADLETLQQWPEMEWPEILNLTNYINGQITAMQALATELEDLARHYTKIS